MKNIRTRNQDGFVSIVITMILMIVITITVLSFAQIIRREQRQALDNQLSSQAFYAAESGVNDVMRIIKTNLGGVPALKETCDGNYGNQTINPVIGPDDSGVSNTCLLVTGNPKDLYFPLNPDQPSTVFPIKTDGPSVGSIKLKWDNDANTDSVSNCNGSDGKLPTSDDYYCPYGVVRIDIAPGDGTPSRDDLMKQTKTYFFVPDDGSAGGGSGSKQAVKCDDDGCEVNIGGLGGKNFYARVQALYEPANLTVTMVGNKEFKEAQVVIDSTGKAQDIVRRVQVRVPLTDTGVHSDYAIQSNESICKYFTTFRSATEAPFPLSSSSCE